MSDRRAAAVQTQPRERLARLRCVPDSHRCSLALSPPAIPAFLFALVVVVVAALAAAAAIPIPI